MVAKYAVLLVFLVIVRDGNNQSYEKGGCRLVTVRSSPCLGNIKCRFSVENFGNTINNWDCIRRVGYYDYSYGRHSYSNDYNLYTYFEDMSSDSVWHYLESYKSHIKIFSVKGGNLTAVPSVVAEMVNLNEFELTNNKIEQLTLNNFINKQMMTKMNLSHNAITSIDADNSDQKVDTLTILDLSYNLLELLPNKCFASFEHLDNLDISHNHLRTLDILTFDSLTHLTTLNLSHNKLTAIGHSLVRFVNLKYLSIDHNILQTLLEINLMSMVKLENLNVSYNQIETIENVALRSLSDLQTLDLSHNHISNIAGSLFKNTSNLKTLLLAYNHLEIIEPGSFESTNVINFSIDNNQISGTIMKNTFTGVKVKNLTLNGGKIQGLGDSAFSTLGANLSLLNLSSNCINNISTTAFKALTMLSVLDLSYNNITELNFDTSDIQDVTVFYARNNKIKKIYKTVFSHLTSLVELDLSHNAINEIELNSFDSLSKLGKLLLNDNDLTNAIDAFVFRRLIAIQRIDFTNTKITTYNNETFSNMTSLTTFISSNGQLTHIAYNAFLGTGSIETLDLSYNLLLDFSINTTTINEVKKIHLNNNRITNITNSTFNGLESLETLDLSFNNVLNVDANSFQSLSNLMILDLSSNSDMNLPSNSLDNLTSLDHVSLSNIRKKMNFINAINTSMSTLFLSKHNIDNINDIFVFHVKNLAKLVLASNLITYIDKYSFQVMKALTLLDLSCNLITEIQPGSFLHTHLITELNLHDNQIQSLQYGVLDGLVNLYNLNLSNNALHHFEANILHTVPHLSILSLENNAIKSLNFRSFSGNKIKLMYLGGNAILCSVLVDLQHSTYFDFNVTAEAFNYTSENVNGVTCKTTVKDVLNDVYNNSGGNLTFMFRELAKTVVDLQETLKVIANNTAVKQDVLKNALSDVSKSVDVLASSYNKSQLASEKNLNTFIRILNESEYKSQDNNTESDNNLNNRSVVSAGILKDVFLNLQHDAKEDSNLKDVRFLLYIIAVSLVLSLVTIVGSILYIFVLRRTKMHLISSQSIQPIMANSMEMD